MTPRGAAQFNVGMVLHWRDFEFPDGSTKNKFFAVIGAKQNRDYLAVIATSKQWRRSANPGCNEAEMNYFIPHGALRCFSTETWLLFDEPVVLSRAEAGRLGAEGVIRPKADRIEQRILQKIRECFERCPDVSPLHVDLLGG